MSNTVTTLDKKAIRKEILVLIVPIILEGIFGYQRQVGMGKIRTRTIARRRAVACRTGRLACFFPGVRDKNHTEVYPDRPRRENNKRQCAASFAG